MTENEKDLDHFLKLALAQVRHRLKSETKPDLVRSLELLEDLLKEQGQTNENSRSATSATR